MFLLGPISYPTARLLDNILGSYHERTFSREGLKTLVELHELPRSPRNLPDQLHPIEVSTIRNLLSLSTIPISDIMTPYKIVFALSSDAPLDDVTRFNILESGFSKVPVYQAEDVERAYGVLDVRCLVGAGFQEQGTKVGEVVLEAVVHLSPDATLADALGIFRNRATNMIVVSEGGRRDGKSLGILTFRDVMEAAIGDEMMTR